MRISEETSNLNHSNFQPNKKKALFKQHSLFTSSEISEAKRILKEDFKLFVESHSDDITVCALTPNSKLLISGGKDQILRIWELEHKRQIGNLIGHTGSITVISITNNSEYVVSGSTDRTIRIWSIQAQSQINLLTGHTNEITKLIIPSHEKCILTLSMDNSVRVWNFASKIQEFITFQHKSTILSIATTLDGSLLAITGFTKEITLYDMTANKEIAKIRCKKSWIKHLSFSNNKKFLFCGGNSSILVWDLEENSKKADFCGHNGWVNDFALPKSDFFLISCGNNSDIKVWSLTEWKLFQVLQGHEGLITSISLFHNDENLISSSYKSIRIWSLITYQQIEVFPIVSQSVEKVLVSQNDLYAVLIGKHRLLRVLQLDIKEIIEFPGHKGLVQYVLPVLRNEYLISAGNDSTIRVWNMAQHRETTVLHGKTSFRALAASSNCKILVSGGIDKQIHMWTLFPSAYLGGLTGHTGYINALMLTQDNLIIISAASDFTVRVWSVTQKEILKVCKGIHKSGVKSLAQVSLTVILATDDDKKIVLWKITS